MWSYHILISLHYIGSVIQVHLSLSEQGLEGNKKFTGTFQKSSHGIRRNLMYPNYRCTEAPGSKEIGW